MRSQRAQDTSVRGCSPAALMPTIWWWSTRWAARWSMTGSSYMRATPISLTWWRIWIPGLIKAQYLFLTQECGFSSPTELFQESECGKAQYMELWLRSHGSVRHIHRAVGRIHHNPRIRAPGGQRVPQREDGWRVDLHACGAHGRHDPLADIRHYAGGHTDNALERRVRDPERGDHHDETALRQVGEEKDVLFGRRLILW